MIRTQIQLTENQSDMLKRISKKYNISISELIRRGVEMVIQSMPEVDIQEKRNRAFSLGGMFYSEEKDLSVNHDKYLNEVYGK